ncbi:MAG: cytochrome c [Anaerolineales bacterium]|nr:cytochrome c [Anaerolineales bacterium]
MTRFSFLLIGLLVLLAAGCSQNTPAAETAVSPTNTPAAGMGMMGRGMGPGSGMMARHQATIPAPHAGLTSPIPADEASIARGGDIFALYCANCHGDGGMGDGPIAANLDPAPAPIAHTSQMLGDDYLFWRISEGGHDFETAMPAWQQGLSEDQRWDVINYVRALGQGTVMPGAMMGGAAFDPAAEQAQRADMLAQAVDQGLITQAEADAFDAVHAEMDQLTTAGMDMPGMDMPGMGMRGNAGQMQQVILDQLIAAELITPEQAAAFTAVHDRLVTAGLMQ